MAKSVRNAGVRNRWIAVLMLTGLCVLLGWIVLGIATIRVWEYSNSVSFCSNACHDVHPEEPAAYQDSYHARVKCTECHTGRISTLQAVVVKSSHARHLPAMLLGNYGRPLESESMRPANETCELCHTPSSFHDDAARSIRHFLPDEGNTERLTYLLLRTGTGAEEASQGFGIHWHISNPVEYIATDDHKQEIRWVRANLPDGRTVEYNDVLNPLLPEELDRAEIWVMDCVDCHNRVGHPYRSPDKLIDQALAEGRLSPALPFVKKEMLALLSAEYADQTEALAAVASLRTRYRDAYPEVAVAYAAEIDQAVEVAKALVPRLVFEEPGVTWQSFSDNIGHKTSPGCFRCHDGQHVSQEGESIRLKCSLCHSIPMTVAAGDGPPEMPIASRQEPASHLEPTFIADHRFAANETCVDCHGPIDFGDDDTGFCANAACHGQSWPMVDLDAMFAHPIRLEGGHAGVQCYSCHDGVTEISYACVNCHDPPAEPHYGTVCQDCHTASSFQAASADGFLHPMPLEGRHEALDCGSCHTTAGTPALECSSCHQVPQDHLTDACDTCHTPAGWQESAISAVNRGPAIPHAFVGTGDCLVCHDPVGPNWPAPPDHETFNNAQCILCHAAGGGDAVEVSHDQVPGLLWGKHTQVACVECHKAGTFQDTPQRCVFCHEDRDVHAGGMGEDCARCHIPDGWVPATYDHTLAAFRLLGRHQAVSCSECHPDNTYAGTPQACVACHGEDDRHGGQFGQDCAQCHTPGGWQGASIDHNLTSYPLTGRHAGVACAQCHPNNTYAGTPQTCVACHGEDDRHRGQFGQDCAQCHTPGGWPGARIDHNLTGYPLTGRHAGVSCAQCHPNNTYAGTPQACVACHGGDDRHGSQFGQDCAQCHTPGGWQGASIDHNLTGYPLTGRHAGVGCAQCHPNNSYAGTPQVCVACHGGDDRHGGQFGQDCAQCHAPEGWPGASIDHNLTGYPLTGRHAGVACAQCHPNNTYAGTPQACVACHGGDDRHGGQFGQDCAQCHTPGGWQGASIDHNLTDFPLTGRHVGVSCAQCHPDNSYAGTPQACSACHGEPAFHAGLLGGDCASCHSPDSWRPASYDQPHTFPFNHGGPASCRTCHPEALAGYTCFACHNPGDIDEEHDEEGIPDYSNCVACHPTGEED